MDNNGSGAARGGNGLITAGVVVAALIAAGVFLSQRNMGELSDEETVALTEPAPTEQAANDNAEPDATEDTATAVRDDPEEIASEAPAPRIDEVRVDGDGILVIAGRASPGSDVEVLLDGAVVTRTTADASGAFAALGSVSDDESARTLTLREGTGETARLSEEEIILAPIDRSVAAAGDAELKSTQDARLPAAETAGQEAEVVSETASGDLETGPEADVSEVPVAEAAQTENQTGSSSQSTAKGPGESGGEPEETVTAALAPDAKPLDTQEEVSTEDTSAQSGSETQTGDGAATLNDVPANSSEPENQTVEEEATATVTAAETGAGPAETPELDRNSEAGDAGAPAKEEDTREIAVLRSDSEGVTLAQPAPATSVALDTIGYSGTGNVELSGRAAVGSVEIRAYLNNRVVAQLPVDEDGTWRGEVPGVDAGVYTLRVDEMAADGSVSSRIETPFKREAPEALAAATAAAQEGPVRAITVQTGDTLWAIARERYGEGLLYVQVFEANRDAIRDPDLIFPGQVFDLPGD